MGLRPARTVRDDKAQPWARMSRATPRKSFVKGAPNPKVRQYIMGAEKFYEMQADLVAVEEIRMRDNALEAARQISNKYMEKHLPLNYYLQLLKYPHYVIREHAALGVAGSDRISKGMKLAFGRPKGRTAKVKKGEAIFRARFMNKDLQVIKAGLKRARLKLSGFFKLVYTDISKEEWNIAKGTVAKVFKVKEVEAPKPEAAAAAAAPTAAEAAAAPAAAGGKAPAGKAEAAPAGKAPGAKPAKA